MATKELSWMDELQQILKVFIKAMAALFITQFNHKCLFLNYIVNPDVETFIVYILVVNVKCTFLVKIIKIENGSQKTFSIIPKSAKLMNVFFP